MFYETMNDRVRDWLIGVKLKELFLVDEERAKGYQEHQVIGAIISAASAMSKNFEKETDYEKADDNRIRQELLDFYGKSEDEEVRNSSMMSQQFVKPIIGYGVYFEDIRSKFAYEAQKEAYDTLYEKLNERILSREKDNQMKL